MKRIVFGRPHDADAEEIDRVTIREIQHVPRALGAGDYLPRPGYLPRRLFMLMALMEKAPCIAC